MKLQLTAAVLALIPFCAEAQLEPPKPSVQATGEAVIQTSPDQAQFTIGVVTEAPSAQDAAAQNASQMQTTLADLRRALGAGGQIHTSGYSLQPNYRSAPDGGQPTIKNFIASNTVVVTTSDLAGLGKLIDVVLGGGANRIQSSQFMLKNDAPVRAQALGEAARQAKGNAEAMAAALGLQLGRVVLLEQGSPQVIRPVVRQFAAAAMASPTAIEPGTVEVHATVTLTMEVH
jgi:uncharacterized protein YggE